jgi:hypothetical protein
MNLKELKHLIKESYITEVGDLKGIKPFPYNSNQILGDTYEFTSNIGKVNVFYEELEQSDTNLNVKYEGFDYTKPQVNVGYDLEGVDSQYLKSNPRELFKILKTVVNITNEYIKDESPYALLFFGVSKDGSLQGDKQKNSLYLSIMNQNLPTGYRLSKATIKPVFLSKEMEGYVLFRK